MDKMEGKTLSIETVNANNKRLLETLEAVFQQLDLPYSHQQALAEADFSSSRKLRECVQAARALQAAIDADHRGNGQSRRSAFTPSTSATKNCNWKGKVVQK